MTTTGADLLNVTTSDGKYTLIQTAEGAMKALRYGEVWDVGTREAIGDKRLLTFAQDLAALRAAVATALELGDAGLDDEAFEGLRAALGRS